MEDKDEDDVNDISRNLMSNMETFMLFTIHLSGWDTKLQQQQNTIVRQLCLARALFFVFYNCGYTKTIEPPQTSPEASLRHLDPK